MLLFSRDKMLGHIKTLYAEWSSIPLYSAEGEESNIALSSLSFEDLTKEAEFAENFDDLIRSDFFGRLRLFKESIAEPVSYTHLDVYKRQRQKSHPLLPLPQKPRRPLRLLHRQARQAAHREVTPPLAPFDKLSSNAVDPNDVQI